MNDRAPVVFAHGLTGSPQGTKSVFLRERFNAVCPNLAGMAIVAQSRAVERALPASGRAVVVGSSLGGLAALELADRLPDRILHLVLLAPAIGFDTRAGLHPELERERPGIFEEAKRVCALAVPSSIPATVVWGLEDPIIRLEDVAALVRRSPSARLVAVHGDHQLNGQLELIATIIQRVRSGRDAVRG